MKLLLLCSFVCLASAGFFDIFSSKKKPEEIVHTTNPDTGELGRIGNPNLGKTVDVVRGRADGNEGSLINIPRNSDSSKQKPTDLPLKPNTRNPISVVTPAAPLFPTVTTTRRIPTTEKEVSRVLPSQETHRSGCPSRVDAFADIRGNSILIDGSTVYFLESGRITKSDNLAHLFPGVSKVNAAVFDPEKDILVIFSERKVYGFRVSGNGFSTHSDYPKDLPDNIAFSPNGALRWHDGHQMLLSSGGMFALYDEYWNKSLMSGRISSYFEGLPDRVRGVSDWKNGKAAIYTQSLVFDYDKERKGVVGEGRTVGEYLRC